MNFTEFAILTALCLFAGMLLCFELGRRIGRKRRASDPDGIGTGSGPVEAAIFGLLGLLLAFTFSGAASRFEERRHLIAEETNAIGTAWLRLDLLPADAQPQLRELFRNYLDQRIRTYQRVEDVTATSSLLQADAALQARIWTAAVAASRSSDATTHAGMLLLPALNAMFDITTTRAVAQQNHPPQIIFVLLGGLSLLSALLVGYVMCGTRVRSWFYMLLVATAMSLTLYVIIDLEYPRYGLIRVDAADQSLVGLRDQMMR